MKMWAYKLDNTVPGCGEPDCCGDNYEEIEWDFRYSLQPLTADEYTEKYGGGEMLEIRQATETEEWAYWCGQEKGWDEAYTALHKDLETGSQENL